MFFARTNPYGSSTSVGFDNTFDALVFTTKAARDEYIEANQGANLAVIPISKKTALRFARRNGDKAYLPTPDGVMIAVSAND